MEIQDCINSGKQKKPNPKKARLRVDSFVLTLAPLPQQISPAEAAQQP